MTALADLQAACASLAADARYAKKTRALASALRVWASESDEGRGVESISSAVFAKTVTLTDSDIKALPSTRFEVIAPTETLGYSGVPATVPFPVSALAVLKTVEDDYDNHDDTTARLMLVWGSDWSLTATELSRRGVPATSQETATFLHGQGIGNATSYGTFGAADSDAPGRLTNAFQDNGLYVALTNALGDLTAGGASNELTISVFYRTLTLT